MVTKERISLPGTTGVQKGKSGQVYASSEGDSVILSSCIYLNLSLEGVVSTIKALIQPLFVLTFKSYHILWSMQSIEIEYNWKMEEIVSEIVSF